MTKSEAFARQHFTRYAGATYSGEHIVYAMEYGMCRSVFREEACNYSYREFWV